MVEPWTDKRVRARKKPRTATKIRRREGNIRGIKRDYGTWRIELSWCKYWNDLAYAMESEAVGYAQSQSCSVTRHQTLDDSMQIA